MQASQHHQKGQECEKRKKEMECILSAPSSFRSLVVYWSVDWSVGVLVARGLWKSDLYKSSRASDSVNSDSSDITDSCDSSDGNDKTQQLKFWPNQKKLNSDKIEKVWLWQNSKTQILIKISL